MPRFSTLFSAGLLAICLASSAVAQMGGPPPQPPPMPDVKAVTERLAYLPEVLATFDPEQTLTREEFIQLGLRELGPVTQPGMTDEMITANLYPMIEMIAQSKLLLVCAKEAGLEPDVASVKQQIAAYIAQAGPDALGGQDPDELATMIADQNIAMEWLNTAIADKVAVTDEEIQAYYDENKAMFTRGPGEKRVSHILISVKPEATEEEKNAAKAKATELLAALKDGGDFAKTATENSDCYSRLYGGDLGFLSEGAMGQDFDAVVSGLEADALSEVVETHRGYHIITITGNRPPQPMPLTDQMKQYIKQNLEQQKFQTEAQAHVDAEAAKRNLTIAVEKPAAPELPMPPMGGAQ